MGLHRRRSSGSVLFLTAASAILPGTAHLVAGRRRVGVTLVGFGVVLGTALAVAYAAMGSSELAQLLVRPQALTVISVTAAVVAVAWITLVVRSYLVVRPPGPPRISERLVGGIVVALLCAGVAAPPLAVVRYAYGSRNLINSVFPDDEVTAVGTGKAVAGDPWKGRQRLNLLLIASDAGPDRDSVRTDSLVVLSADVHTGNVTMFSIPRNLAQAPMPTGPLREAFGEQFPDLINALYRRVTETDGLLAGPRVRDRGAEGLKRVTGNILGLRVDYYVMINLAGFEKFVNALGGVNITVAERLPIGGVLADGTHVPPIGYIEPGRQKLDGYHALWYARSRRDSSDYARMARQRCLIGAVARQVSPAVVLTRFQALASATKQLVATDIPRDLLPAMVGLGEQVRRKGEMRSVQFVPPLIQTGDPDYELIRTKVRQALATPAKGTPRPGGTAPKTTSPPRANPAPGTTGSGGPGTTGTGGGRTQDAQNVDQACALA